MKKYKVNNNEILEERDCHLKSDIELFNNLSKVERNLNLPKAVCNIVEF